MINHFKQLNNTTAYQLYQLSRLAVVILISILLVKTGYDTTGVSRYERFIFLANLFTFFWVMGIKNAALSYYSSLVEKLRTSFFYNAFFILQGIGVVFALIVYSLVGFQLFSGVLVWVYRPTYCGLALLPNLTFNKVMSFCFCFCTYGCVGCFFYFLILGWWEKLVLGL